MLRKQITVVVLLLSSVACADYPAQNTDCSGAPITSEEYSLLTGVLDDIAAQYCAVFTTPYEYCSELPLYLEGVPSTCQVSNGWRNYYENPETFLFEPLTVKLFTVDDLLQLGDIPPEDEANLRARNYLFGNCSGVVTTSQGEAAFTGVLFSWADDLGVQWSYLLVKGILTTDQADRRRSLLECDLNMSVLNPKFAPCYNQFHQCRDNAQNELDEDLEGASDDWWLCMGAVGLGVALQSTCLGCTAGGPFAPICWYGCLCLMGTESVLGATICQNSWEGAVDAAQDQYDNAMAWCKHNLDDCIAAVNNSGGSGSSASSPPASVVR